MYKLKAIISLLRPEQWLKNILIFIPMFFARKIGSLPELMDVVYAFATCCLTASSVYCFNDIMDADIDRAHEKKRGRPIASGTISKKSAFAVMAVLIAAAALILYIGRAPAGVVYLLILYFLMNLAYSAYLKQFAITDVLIISLGFVIRLFIGGVAGDVVLSHWIIIMTFLLALFLAFAKRKDDYAIFEETGVKPRKNIGRYNSGFLNTVLSILSAIIIVAYIMYTVSAEVIERIGSEYLYTTSFFVLSGILRYLQLTIVDKKSGSPTKILIHDRTIQIIILGWILLFAWFLYF